MTNQFSKNSKDINKSFQKKKYRSPVKIYKTFNLTKENKIMFLSIKVEKMYTFDNTQCRRVCIWGNKQSQKC